MKNGTQLPLKGLILQNGIVDYRFDPNTHSLDQFYAFGIIPQDLYNQYKENKC